MSREFPSKGASERGSSLLEFALLFPMLFFLMIGIFDVGFLINAMITVENAARIAALDTSSSIATASGKSVLACTDVLNELAELPNHGQLPSSCNASPLQVTAVAVTGPDGNPASQVTVTYQTIQLIPIPGVPGNLSITRVAEMRNQT